MWFQDVWCPYLSAVSVTGRDTVIGVPVRCHTDFSCLTKKRHGNFTHTAKTHVCVCVMWGNLLCQDAQCTNRVMYFLIYLFFPFVDPLQGIGSNKDQMQKFLNMTHDQSHAHNILRIQHDFGIIRFHLTSALKVKQTVWLLPGTLCRTECAECVQVEVSLVAYRPPV